MKLYTKISEIQVKDINIKISFPQAIMLYL